MNTPLIVILGPTGSGKSSLSIQIAKAFSCEIVNCDSVQIYQYLDIGSSKLSKAAQAHIPHHLLDLRKPDQLFTAGEYVRLGRKVLKEIQRRNHVPLVVGGTGLYLRALLEGLFPGPPRSDYLRKRLERLGQKKGISFLHRLLARVDPVSAVRIAIQDKPKIIRALEVFYLTSKPLSVHFLSGREPLLGFTISKIGLDPPRDLLYRSIDQRVDTMFSQGLVEEVKWIMSLGFSPDLKPLQSLGYAQVVKYLRGELSLEEARTSTKVETRRYAKRQLTWFRKEKEVTWYLGFGSDPHLQSEVKNRVAVCLGQQENDLVSSGRNEPGVKDVGLL